MSIVDIILAILLPPLAVFLRKGAGKDFIISLLLTLLLFWLGGIIHAFWLLSKKA
ncbi:MAG: YqaE/Pmp3 family membrane protein [Opitutaceae bacterium]|nr:YqaE/Pmp3 family membrane protein [Opitutaceae bacterium]